MFCKIYLIVTCLNLRICISTYIVDSKPLEWLRYIQHTTLVSYSLYLLKFKRNQGKHISRTKHDQACYNYCRVVDMVGLWYDIIVILLYILLYLLVCARNQCKKPEHRTPWNQKNWPSNIKHVALCHRQVDILSHHLLATTFPQDRAAVFHLVDLKASVGLCWTVVGHPKPCPANESNLRSLLV